MSCIIKRILTFNTAFIYGKISIYNSNDEDISKNCLYSWSGDGVCWTNWVDYNSYINLSKNLEGDMFWRVTLMDSLKAVMIDSIPTTCYSITLDDSNPFLQEFCNTSNLFNPYANLDCALLLQQQMSDSILCMFGIPIYYFKVDPQAETKDYTFKEYLLHNITSVKQIKMMLQDGAMPSSKPVFANDDFNWEVDWDVELSKRQFANAFGDNAFPSQRDFIYVPMMKRLWSVNAAYDEKQEMMMWRSTTWNLGLRKYEERTNVDAGDFENTLSSLIDNTMFETFGKYEELEQERESGTTQVQMPDYMTNNLYDISIQDAIRKSYTPGLQIVSKQLNNLSTVVARNMYRFKTGEVVLYQRQPCLESGAITLIINDVVSEGEESMTLFQMDTVKIESKYNNEKQCSDLIFNDLHQPLHYYRIYNNFQSKPTKQYSNDVIVLIRWNKATFTIDMNIYPYVHKDIKASKINQTSYYFDFDNPVCSLTGPYNTELATIKPTEMLLQGKRGLNVYNLKVWNSAIDVKQLQVEAMKYVTNDKRCIVNDCVRDFDMNLGFAVK